MKISGKLLSAALASVLVFSLAGCGDKEESKTFNANLAGTEISITYTYKGDKIIKQTSESKISYATVGAKTKEDAAKILDPLSAKYKNIAGVEEKLTYEDTYAQENVSVDMEKWHNVLHRLVKSLRALLQQRLFFMNSEKRQPRCKSPRQSL